MKMIRTPIAMALASTLVLVGCGGGSDDESSPNKPSKPVAPPSSVKVSIDSQKKVNEPADGILSSTIQVKLSAAHSEDVTVKYAFTPVSAELGKDFTGQDGLLTIPKGARSGEISFEILGDSLDENDEEFLITLSEPTNAEISSGGDVSRITIIDEDDEAKIQFETDFVQVIEGAGIYNVNVSLSTYTEKDVIIPFSLSGLATRNSDYYLLSLSPVTVPAGANEVAIQFEILQDFIPEGGENIDIQLETPTNASIGDTSKITLFIPGDLGLNDTGMTTSFDGTGYTSASETGDYPGQDAAFGRDVTDNFRFDGEAGFTYTKLDKAGNALASDETEFACVQDNQTGLIWETKQVSHDLSAFNGLSARETKDYIISELNEETYSHYPAHSDWRSNNYRYYWYNDNNKANGGHKGVTGSPFVNLQYPINELCAFPTHESVGFISAAKGCDTNVYRNALNSISHCGYQDWRLPTTNELKSIINYSTSATLTRDETFFPNTDSGTYLTADPSADGVGAVWCVESQTGETKLCKKQLPNKVRMVRGGAL